MKTQFCDVLVLGACPKTDFQVKFSVRCTMSSCGIELENCPSNTILSGQILRGTVRLTTIKAYTVRSVYVKLHGYGRVRWTEFENYETYDAHEKKNVTKQRLVERSREEEYLNQRTFLIPSTGSGKQTTNDFEYVPICADSFIIIILFSFKRNALNAWNVSIYL